MSPLRADGTREYSESSIATYKECPLQFFYKYETGLEKIEEEANEHHLVYGKAMHEALKRIYLKDTLESAIKSFKESYPIQLDTEDNAKTIPHGIQVLKDYVSHWSEQDKKWKVIEVEQVASFAYQESGFTVVLDLVMENIEYGGIYGWDHKVVGGKKATLGFDFWNQFEPNSQVTKYYSFIESKYGACSGFFINAIGMGYRSRAYKGEPAGTWHRFQRQMFNRNKSQLELEQRDTRYWIERIEEDRKHGYWAMNTGACRWCSYRPVCSAGWTWPEDRELIEIQYKVNPQVAPQVSEQKGSTLNEHSTGVLSE